MCGNFASVVQLTLYTLRDLVRGRMSESMVTRRPATTNKALGDGGGGTSGQTDIQMPRKALVKRSQHFNVTCLTYRNIVGLFRDSLGFGWLTKPNILQQGGQTSTTFCVQQCYVEML